MTTDTEGVQERGGATGTGLAVLRNLTVPLPLGGASGGSGDRGSADWGGRTRGFPRPAACCEGPGQLRRRSRPRLPAAALSPGAPLGCQREAATCSGAESLLAARRQGEQPPRRLPRPQTAARREKLPPRSAAGGKSPACRRRLLAASRSRRGQAG